MSLWSGRTEPTLPMVPSIAKDESFCIKGFTTATLSFIAI